MRALLRGLPDAAELLTLNEVLVFRFRPEDAVPDDGGVDDNDDAAATAAIVDPADDSDFFADDSDRPLTAELDLSFDFLPAVVVVADDELEPVTDAADDAFFPLADTLLLP